MIDDLFHERMRETWRAVESSYPEGITPPQLLDEMRKRGLANEYVMVIDVANALRDGAIPELSRYR